MPKNLQCQIVPMFKCIEALGLPLLSVIGVEADDVIGTIAVEAEKDQYHVLIRTCDKDIAQLVTENIKLIDNFYNIIGPKEVQYKYGVIAKYMVDFIALAGDYADNIPGVPGIGKKTAKILLENFNGLEDIYANIKKIFSILHLKRKEIITKNLIKNKDIAILSYKLATIKKNVKLEISYDQLYVQAPNIKKLSTVLKYYNFKFWLLAYEKNKYIVK